MKFKSPAFLDGIESPIEGEIAVRKYAAECYPLDLFSAAQDNSAAQTVVVGIDEVGRGPLAGPVVACAAVLKAPDALLSLNDSKKLTRPKREAMFESVKDACECYAIASASVKEIDEINILEADFRAMRRALQALGMQGLNETAPDIPIEVKGALPANARALIIVDGNMKIDLMPQDIQMPVVKGDGRVASVSAASILAKVFRDRYMDKLEKKYPGYGFDKHAGYGTKAHLDAIRKMGFSPEHRMSFHPKL